MTTNARSVKARPDQIWDVLSDGWLYPVWVVGATRMRDVDRGWPTPGSCLHHSIGVWPVVVSDTTEVIDAVPGRMLHLRARGSALGDAEVRITLAAAGNDETRVEIEEDAVSGPGRLVPTALREPLIKVRNVETLRRLAFIAEHRTKA